MKLLLDENLSPRQATMLRDLGFDAQSVIDAGLGGAPDHQIREFAIQQNRILITLDADFGNLLRFPTAGTPGVIRLKIQSPTEKAISERIQKVLAVIGDTSLVGCLAVSHGDVVRIRS